MSRLDRSAGFPSRAFWILAVGIVFLPGCSQEWKDREYPTVPVSGRLSFAGVAIDQGWIELVPDQGTLGRSRSAPLGKDGVFLIDRAPVGWVIVVVTNPPFPLTRDGSRGRSIFEVTLSPVRLEIPAEGLSDLVIDLTDPRLRRPNR